MSPRPPQSRQPPPRWIAEWEPCRAVWLAWPHRRATWPGRFEAIPRAFADLACRLAAVTRVRLVAEDSLIEAARDQLARSPHFGEGLPIDFLPCPTDDCWIRDYGPVWTQDALSGEVVAVNFRYNAWGGKYPPWDRDAAVSAAMTDAVGVRRLSSTLCLEGGAIETDGRGRLLTTRSCLLDHRRNPDRSEHDVARELHRCLGVTEIVWLGRDPADASESPLAGDDTDGHVDQLARFLTPNHIVVACHQDPSQPQAGPLNEIAAQLDAWAETTRPRVRVDRWPMPPPRHIDGQPVPQSYCNFLRIGPDHLFLPSFGDPESESEVIASLSRTLPSCRVETMDCRDLVWGLGALHCLSLQEPAAPTGGPPGSDRRSTLGNR